MVTKMRDDKQFEQLILQYEQLKNGAEDIYNMIEAEDYDGAISMTKTREPVFLNCKCIRKYLELTPEQEEKITALTDEIRKLEKRNIKFLTEKMDAVKNELKKTHKSEKIQMAYDFDESKKGSIVNIKD